MKVFKQIILIVIRFLVGGLFIFSGLIKVNDPVGTSIKLEEYFDVFSYDIASFFEYFKAVSLPLAVFLVVLEVGLGVMLILGVRLRLTVYLLLFMIVFFTFLTFYSAYFDKVTDCGCFGDAIKLTPWESFYKDIFLLIGIVILWVFRHDLPKSSTMLGNTLAASSFVLALLLSVIAIRNLPFVDFRAYKEGVDINKAMQPSTALEYSYLMEKDGEEVVLDQYPTEEGYEFIEMKLKNPEALPKISDFAVWNDQGDFTEEILSGPKLLILVSNISKMSNNNLSKIGETLREIQDSGINPALVCASSEEEIRQLLQDNGWNIDYYLADATVVKTIIRSNPGILLLEDGVVLKKFHHNNIPTGKQTLDFFKR